MVIFLQDEILAQHFRMLAEQQKFRLVSQKIVSEIKN